MSVRDEFLCYTDGSCKASDGAPGEWGFVIKEPSGSEREGFGKARATLAKVIEYRAVAVRDARHHYRFALAPGDFLLYDNHRMPAFRGARWVRGIYFDPA